LSIPVTTYNCTACDFSGWNCVTWGYRFYQTSNAKLRIRTRLGWCFSCGTLTAMEVLPNAAEEVRLERKLSKAEERLNILRRRIGKIRSAWHLFPRKGALQIKLELEVEFAQKELRDYMLIKNALAARSNPAVCLECGSEDCTELPSHPSRIDEFDDAPALIGFTHPGCGGNLVAINDGLRLNIRLERRAYDINGRQIKNN